MGKFMIRESAYRPPHVIAEELSRENDLDQAAELATELARSLEAQRQELAKPACSIDHCASLGGPPKGV
jgi:hypothetical protein